MRIQFEFSNEAVKQLEDIQERLNLKHRGEVVNHALGVLRWLLNEKMNNSRVLLQRAADRDSAVEVVFPEIEFLLKKDSGRKQDAESEPRRELQSGSLRRK